MVIALIVVLSAVALFFASFLSWMVLGLHKKDWLNVPQEDEFMAAIRPFNIPVGNFMFPYACHGADMKSPEFQKKFFAAQGARAGRAVARARRCAPAGRGS